MAAPSTPAAAPIAVPNTLVASDTLYCAHCYALPSELPEGTALQRCSGCSIAVCRVSAPQPRYCSLQHQKDGWKAHKAACVAQRKGRQYIVHLDIGSDMTKGAPWCANLVELLLSSNTHMLYLVESFKAMEDAFNHPIRPSAIFCSSGDFTKRGQREMWKTTRDWVSEGGRFVIGGPGVSHMRPDAMNEMLSGLGLPWQMLEYMRTTHFRNDAHPLFSALPPKAVARTLLPKSYSMKSIMLEGVADQDALYRSTEESQVESLAMAVLGGEMSGGKVAVAATAVGQGWIGWVGDVNQEGDSDKGVCFLLGYEYFR